MPFQAIRLYLAFTFVLLWAAVAIVPAGCSDAPKIVNLSGSHGRRGDDTVRISRIVVQPGASDSESRFAAEIVAGRLKRELEATIPVVYADPFRTPAGPERLAGVLVLELSTFEPVFKPFAQDKARFRIGVRLTKIGRPFGLNPRLRDLNFMQDDSLSFQQAKEVSYARSGQRKSALKLAAGKIADDLLENLHKQIETVPSFSVPDYLYGPPPDSRAYDWAGGTVIQLGSTPHLRRFEVRHFPLAEDRERQLDGFLELMRNNGYEPGRTADYSSLYELTAEEIEFKGGDDLQAFLTFPPDAELQKKYGAGDIWNHVRLTFTEAAPPDIPQEAFDRFRREDLRSFACAGGFRLLRGKELAREFDRLAEMPEASYNDLFHLYDDTGDAEQLPVAEERRERLLERIRARLLQSDSPDFNFGAAGLLKRLGFDKNCTPEQLKKLEPLRPLLVRFDGANPELSQGAVRHFPLSGERRFIILVTPRKADEPSHFTTARFVSPPDASGFLEMNGSRWEIPQEFSGKLHGVVHSWFLHGTTTSQETVAGEEVSLKALSHRTGDKLLVGLFLNSRKNRLEICAYQPPPQTKSINRSE